MPPIKDSVTCLESRLSSSCESMQKYVECTFGILKGCWQMLKPGMNVYSTTPVEQIWRMCCALHNLLLEVDGLAETWKDGTTTVIPSD